MTNEELEQFAKDNRMAIDGIMKTLGKITDAIERILKFLGL